MTHAVSTCRSCGAHIRFVTTPKGKSQPLDAEPVLAGGNVRIDWLNGEEIAITLTKDELAIAQTLKTPLYVSHYATCPNADDWRRHA